MGMWAVSWGDMASSVGAACGGQGGGVEAGAVAVEGRDEGLGAAKGTVDVDLEMQVGGAAVAGVPRREDLLAGVDVVALVDLESGAVAVVGRPGISGQVGDVGSRPVRGACSG
jgi:hypothetical protein